MNDDRSAAMNSEPANNGGDFDWTLALSIEERISLQSTHCMLDSAASDTDVQTYLGRWANAFAKGDMAALKRRLDWDGISVSQITSALNPSSLNPSSLNPSSNDTKPDWKAALEHGLTSIAARGSSTTLILPARFRASNQPFPELWWAWSEVWSAQISSNHAELLTLGESAIDDCKVELVATLAAFGADALYQEFQLSRAAPEGSTQYRRFIRSFDGAAWQMLFIKYPLLARQIGTALLQAQHSIAQLRGALAQNRQALAQQFDIEISAQIINIEALGDAHRGGLRVRRIRFSDGKSVIFKPRNCALEARWNDLLVVINESGFTPKLASLRYVLGAEHAWFEDIQHANCDSPAQIAERFSQYGALIALSYVTHARDLHQDNMIVGAQGPVLIDSETVLQPPGALLTGPASSQAPVKDGASTMARAAAELERSCLGSGLVRFPAQSATGETWDESALCGVSRASKIQSWLGLGTDRLLPGQVEISARTPSHRVISQDGCLLQAADYLAELCAGFSAAYVLLQGRDAKVEAALSAMCAAQVRVVLRPTRFYAAALQGLSSARVQRNGANATLILATLQRHWASAEEVPNLWPMLRAEALALMRGDVPVFHVRGDSCDLLGETAVSKDAWGMSAQSSLELALKSLSDADLARQLDWLRSSLLAHPNESAQTGESARAVFSHTPLPGAPALGAGALRALVLECAEQLLQAGVRGGDGEITWLAPGHLTPNARTGRGVSHYLYDGSLGVAWFLAAAGRVLQRPELSEAARHAYAPVRRFLRDPAAPLLVAREPMGVGHGLGSVVAGITILGQELADPKLFEDAERALTLIDARMAHPRSAGESNNEPADLEGGLAGALLGIVRLIEATGARTLLRSARPLVQRLRELQHPRLGWRGYDGRPLSGFMHGQSGISYALLAYNTLAQEGSAHALSESGFALEEQNFDAAQGAWPLWLDVRSDTTNSAASARAAHNMIGTWCNGNAGILLARTAYSRKAQAQEQAHLLRAAIQLYDDVPAGVDHLCCGNLGRALALTQLARTPQMADALAQSGRDDAGPRAQIWLAAVVQAAQTRGRYLLREDAQQNLAFQPGLYRGIAGVGFAALTLGWPERMGCVLRFQGFSR